jgi:hypothetical protein
MIQCMARAIARFSLDGDNKTGGKNTNAARKLLEDEGFVNIGTGSYEATDIDIDDALGAIALLVARLHQSQLEGRVSLDHLWIYVDEPTPKG